MDSETRKIFRENSTSYYYSSLFFPEEVKEKVFKLYAYTRKADDYVDEIPQDKKGYYKFRESSKKALSGERTDNKIVNQFVEMAEKEGIRQEWIFTFLDSMEMDLQRSEYLTIEDSIDYINGSAEVIGLMMCKILDLEEGSFRNARLLGRAMQYCNFIRDIDEDNKLGRQYLPTEEIEEFGLKNLEEDHVRNHPQKFKEFMYRQLDRYWKWEEEARKGFEYIPYRYRVPVKVSSEIYEYTAEKIKQDPFIVYEKKVKPSRKRIALIFAKNLRG